MDIGSPVGTSVSEHINRSQYLKQLYPESSQCNGGVMDGVSLNDLGNDLNEFLHIQDDHILASNSISPRSDKNSNNNVEKEDQCEEPHQDASTIVTSEKCLAKCTTFPCSSEKGPFAVSIDGEDEDSEDEEVEEEEEEDDLTAAVLKQNGYDSVKPSQPQCILLPSPLNLVSAMKGSREKQGTPPKKLAVTWAPDVYDPPPSASTIVRVRKPVPKSESKKNGKNKQTGKPAKGGSGKDKDKKQARKYGRGSNKCYQSQVDDDMMDDYNGQSGVLRGDFGVGSLDSYCGNIFRKKSISKLHFSVAEAT